MTTLIFLLTVLALLILALSLLVRVIRHQPVRRLLQLIGLLGISYGVGWLGFFFIRTYRPVALGTDVCFDDWCATVTQAIRLPASSPDSLTVILQVRASNHARGIAQKPSQPRLHLLDGTGRAWLAVVTGESIPLDTRLQLHESKSITLVCTIPAVTSQLTALLEEGPWLTRLLFPEDQPVFVIP